MIAIDTNVLVRLVLEDDLEQWNQVVNLLKTSSDIFVSDTVLLESLWVSTKLHNFRTEDAFFKLDSVYQQFSFHAVTKARFAQLKELVSGGLDFADALHLLTSPQSATFYTFDQKFRSAALKVGLDHVLVP